MSEQQTTSAAVSPGCRGQTDSLTVEEVLVAVRHSVRRLGPEFTARAAEGEATRTMPVDLVEKAKRAGLFRLNLPRSLGGLELDPATTVEILEEISRADGSAGWTVLIGNSTAFFAWLEPAVAKEMVAGDPDFVSTSMFAPLGEAAPGVSGGLTVSGRWPFNSGCPHAAWLQVGVTVTDGGRQRTRPDGAPDWHLAFVPRELVQIEDTWHAAGAPGHGKPSRLDLFEAGAGGALRGALLRARPS